MILGASRQRIHNIASPFLNAIPDPYSGTRVLKKGGICILWPRSTRILAIAVVD